MLLNDNGKQKSPKRRFLLILGVTAFTGFCILGLMIIFWDKFPLDLPVTQRRIFGSIILIYAVLRFSRYLRKSPEDEE
ncbi:hypothetical protein BC343_12795 [Mucilaginibacter pedocola]|uniref:Uncharacterized protein n=1 Tax=Mucilaginibacter pedocola TaxID=1792845 RepID=A0A1S9P9P4_9SPHI|nr:hypothetical protein BC343_12795 [Mucilaginibacter pedocola]